MVSEDPKLKRLGLLMSGVYPELKLVQIQTRNNGAGDSNPETINAQINVTYPQGIIKKWK